MSAPSDLVGTGGVGSSIGAEHDRAGAAGADQVAGFASAGPGECVEDGCASARARRTRLCEVHYCAALDRVRDGKLRPSRSIPGAKKPSRTREEFAVEQRAAAERRAAEGADAIVAYVKAQGGGPVSKTRLRVALTVATDRAIKAAIDSGRLRSVRAGVPVPGYYVNEEG